MNPNQFLDNNNPVCIGTGLVALDVVVGNENPNSTQFLAGGSCGNVLAILSYLGWNSFPIARLSNNVAAELLIDDLHYWNVKDDLLSVTNDGSTPIIIHRILKDKQGFAKHRFEFRNPEDGSYLPSYKPVLASKVNEIVAKKSFCNVFYFDRINRGAIELAKAYKGNGSIIFFEPSNSKDIKLFNECLEIADVVKFSNDRISNLDDFPQFFNVPLLIQTLGKDGLRFRRTGTEWIELESYNINNVLDSAGAGDWCTAGIIKTLFKEPTNIDKFTDIQIINAIEFGQALSSLNCTFEGARGLMYSLNNSELILYVEHIIDLNLKSIPTRARKIPSTNNKSKDLKISSLFMSVS